MPERHCELCEAARITPRYFDGPEFWIAECEACSVPMVVWNDHGPNPPEEIRAAALTQLRELCEQQLGGEFWLDENMRTVPDHWHAHARPKRW